MPDSRATIAFPQNVATDPVDALQRVPALAELNDLQVQLVLTMYARADQSRVNGQEDAVPSQFLRVIVTLIDVLELNGVDDAPRCMDELKKIIRAIYPEAPSLATGNHH
ncbi:hypothetical protein [Caballeronia sp. LZ001]|uniref:hypothetical protein n=1 Tax=Caballeronia sp. LZ001 TaxID=3038553 RepID=UPI002862F1F9|nr:hypothetical protein [Caballeronia sp. LZ001]MDR5806475.1 hypothetical protein [Caballeronia sp. LZ001]